MGLAPSLLVLALLQQAPRSASLDFEVFRTRVQPIFLEKREGHARCVVCHTRATTPFRLQPLSPGSTSWNDEESRRNFTAAERFVVPGEPLRSRLLTMALAEEAGGAAFHPGGKHWESRDDSEWRTLADWVANGSAAPAAGRGLDFEVFRARVEPIFLQKRAGRARCVVCHTRATTPFRLQVLPQGRASWSEEESRLNFEAVGRLVAPGDPLASRLLLMPLAEDGGGTAFHPGGKHWESQDEPEWQSLADWVRGRP
jgi:hypothetical protein